MKKRDSLINQKFGRLLVIAETTRSTGKSKTARWICKCDCGKETIVYQGSLLNGTSKSCGCFAIERSTTHGKSRTYESNIYFQIKRRCYNEKDKYYKDYGGRGIFMSDEWKNSIETFLKDIGKRPQGTQFDRINNNKGYSKDNFRWVTPSENCRNKRNNIKLTYNNETKTLKEWSEITKISFGTLSYRYHSNWTVADILTLPIQTCGYKRKGARNE